MSQTSWILKQLQLGRSLTALDALSGCQCFRLAPRILELRVAGHNIVTNIVKNNGKRYATYTLVKGKKNGK